MALDLGGVLVRVDFARCLRRLSRLTGRPPGVLRKAIFDSGLKDLHDAGRIGFERFARAALAGARARLDLRLFRAAWADIFEPYPATSRLVAAARRAGLRVVLFSVTDAVHVDHIRARWRFLDGFDGMALSYELRALKPDAAFFRRACRRLAIDPRDTLLIDDRAENVDAARALGFAAVRARGAGAALRSLRAAGLVPL